MSVDLSRTTNFMAGTYVVTVGGIDLSTNSATTTVEAQKVSQIEIASSNIIVNATAPVTYTVKDQYGTEITRNSNVFTWTATNVTKGTNVVVTSGATTDLTLNTAAADVDDVIRVTALLPTDPTVKVTKDITVSNIYVGTFNFGEVVFEEGQTRLDESTLAYDVEISYTALDNYGLAVDLADGTGATIDNITFATSNADLVDLANTEVADGVLTFEISANESGTAIITAINNNTGVTSSIQIQVYATAYPNTAEFGDNMIIEGDVDTYEIPVTFFDQFGEEMDANDLLSYTLTDNFNVNVLGAGTLTLAADLSADGENIEVANAVEGTYTLSLTNTDTGAVSSTSIVVNEPRVPSELVVDTAPTTTLIAAGTTTVQFIIKDQYGDEMDGAEPEAANYQLVATKTSNANVILAAPLDDATYALGTAAGDAMAEIEIEAGAAAATDTLTFTLEDTVNSVNVDAKSFAFTIVADADNFVVTTDKATYTAGDTIAVTAKAQLSGSFYNKFNDTLTCAVTVGAKTYFRDITFVNGVGTTTVPATTAGTALALDVAIDNSASYGTYSATDIDVDVAAASKFNLVADAGGTDIDVTLTDAYDNTITTFVGNKTLKVSVPTGVTVTGADAEGNVIVDFTAGVGTVVTSANDTTGTYSATFGTYTGSYVVD